MKKCAILLFCILFIVIGCVMTNKMSRLSPGMTKAEVYQVLGSPEGYKARGDFEKSSYICGLRD